MNYTISNGIIEATISTMGAEIVSIKNLKNNFEYIWQGDPTYWTGHAYNLFPICGRLTEGKYTYKGNTYEMNLHGFARKTEYELHSKSNDKVSFILVSTDATKKMYPFDFELIITYTLNGASITTEMSVTNKGSDKMYFAVGAHPGFNLPLCKDGVFEDWYLEFSEKSKPELLQMSDTCYYLNDTKPFPLEDDTKLHLVHTLFNNDALFLKNVSKSVTLKSDKSSHYVKFDYPSMNYVGIWHAPKTQAPYVCIEPWVSIPADNNVVDDLETKRDMLTLNAGENYVNKFTITAE